jgi:membrane protein implicated in regulation of membrane protease activity
MSHEMVMKLLGAFAIVIGASLAVAALLGFLVTAWVTIGMSLLVIALLAMHKRRPVRVRRGDLEVTVQHRAPHGGG